MISNEYIEGNAARRMAAMPERQTEQEQKAAPERKKRSRRVRRNQERALRMGLPYVLMLGAATLASVYVCVSFLRVQSGIISSMENISSMESQLQKIKRENDMQENQLTASIDLDYVYEVATTQLGMVYPKADQQINYDESEREYVRQNEDIPEN